MNIIGVLEGQDEKLKNEYIVISAHLDHVGSQAGLIFFPGANDNASGSAAVLEIAEAYITGKLKPARSIVFILFACEENGLDGAKYCADHFPFPLEKITALMNMDCIGYGDSIQIGNGESNPKLWKSAMTLDQSNFKLAVENTWKGGGADATPFYEKGVPALYFVTKNSYDHLHLLTDTPETLNKSLLEKITKLVFLTSWEVASGKYIRETVVK